MRYSRELAEENFKFASENKRVAVMEYPSDIFQYCAPVIYYFVVEAPSVSNIPSFSFFDNGICYERPTEEKEEEEKSFYFPSATAAPVRKQLGRWDLLFLSISNQGTEKKEREKKNRSVRMRRGK